MIAGKQPLLDAAGIRGIADALNPALGMPVAGSRTGWVRNVPAGTRSVYVKVLTYPTLKDVMLRLASRRFFWHRARREWQCIALQDDLGLPAVPRVCFGEVRQNGILRAAVLVTEEVPAAVKLDAWLREAERSAAPGVIGGYVARLHAAGFHHGDLNARNLLVAAGSSGTPDCWNVDSGRGRRCDWHGRITTDHIRDLAPLLLAFRVIVGADSMQSLTRAYASLLGVGFTRATSRMLEAEMIRIEPRELRRLSAPPQA